MCVMMDTMASMTIHTLPFLDSNSEQNYLQTVLEENNF